MQNLWWKTGKTRRMPDNKDRHTRAHITHTYTHTCTHNTHTHTTLHNRDHFNGLFMNYGSNLSFQAIKNLNPNVIMQKKKKQQKV